MEYKRLELHVGWTCNQKCTYCMEYRHMESQWNKKVTIHDILKDLIKYKKNGYNHVTFLGGEPFIQPVFLDALKLGKKLGYKILVTTNATTLHIDEQAKKYLPYIDELILSVEAIDISLQKNISRTNVYVRWEEVFNNINKHWIGSLLKINIVITNDNLLYLESIVNYLLSKKIKNIAITYPDLELDYYGKEHLVSYVAPKYSETIKIINNIYKICIENNILLKIVDIPFCIFDKESIDNYIKITDDIDYGNRVKISTSIYENPKFIESDEDIKDSMRGKEIDRFLEDKGNEDINERYELNRNEYTPRHRRKIGKCSGCKYYKKCWGPAINYEFLYGYGEINPIKDD